ncbi:MAG: proprotein convertase P-domain-containing protein [Chitinophagales bacterium]|nr:proprotein convertase P-domain-containing protein [Chitinophagales bacterium]
MKYFYQCLGLCWLWLCTSLPTVAQSSLWTMSSDAAVSPISVRYVVPQKYVVQHLQLDAMRQFLAGAPMEFTPEAARQALSLQLPMPDGTTANFQVVQSPIMHPDLARKYPDISTYAAYGITDRTASARIDITPQGFHAMILSANGTVFIDPYCKGNITYYIVYYKRDYYNTEKANFRCYTGDKGTKLTPANQNDRRYTTQPPLPTAQMSQVGTNLRTYRTVVSATGEYTAFHGGTKPLALAAIVTSVNRVTGVYERDLSVRLSLVANNDAVIYTNANTDPFSNDSPGQLIDENQTVVDNNIGNANYDIGHNFSTGGGGLASLGVPCATGWKAQGITGSGSPVGDPFDIDYVAHEMGHQFGGNHSFNSTSGSCGGNRETSAAYEPGSGSTIMSYAGICGAGDLQPHSDDYFHVHNLIECLDYIINGDGNNCPTLTNISNQDPVANAGADYVIPKNTPFVLTGSATDANAADALTYCWEEYDLGPAGNPNSPSGNAPIFRSWEPTTSSKRYFPRPQDLVANTTTFGETMPTYARSMVFRLTVRDNHNGGGSVNSDAMNITVADSGPFQVTYPNATGISWAAGNSYTVTWNVNNTNTAPVNCQNVDIFLIVNNNIESPVTLLANTPNDGTQSITVPVSVTATSVARVMVKGSGNIFFDISNNNFALTVPTSPTFTLASSNANQSLCSVTSATFPITTTAFGGFSSNVQLSYTISPSGSGMTGTFSPNPVAANGSTNFVLAGIANAPVGTYNITVTGTGGSVTQTLQLSLTTAAAAPDAVDLSSPVNGAANIGLSPTFSWYASPKAASYTIQLSNNNSFANIVAEQSGVTTTTHTFSAPLILSNTYYWRVKAQNGCGESAYSSTNSFTTSTPSCTTFNATNVPVSIAASGTPTVTSTLNITQNLTIADLNVKNLVGTHTYISDLIFSLTSPTGTTVDLIANICGNEDNFNINLDDEATNANYPCPPVGGGTYIPAENLSAFDGQSSNGIWTLTIADVYDEDGGQVTSWGVEICSAAATSTDFILQTRAFLQGAYNTAGAMTNVLRTNNLIPTAQPYNVAPISYNGTQSVASASAIPANTTDWMLVEVRNATTNALVTRKAGFLLNNGRIVDVDGTTTGIKFSGLTNDTPYLVVLRHRNHAPVVSSQVVKFYNNQASYNFTTKVEQASGTMPMTTTADGYAVLWAGDYVPNGILSYTDFNAYITNQTNNVYVVSDGNLDKQVNQNDFMLYKNNAGKIMIPLIRY